MDLGLRGKVAIVTGGSRGIGRAIATRLAAEGAAVMLTSRKAEVLTQTAAAIEHEAGPNAGALSWFAANAGDPDAPDACIDATHERLGPVDLLVNNAGTNPYYGPLVELDAPRARKTVQVNQDAVLAWTQGAWRASMAERGGAVLNIASIGGLSVEPGIGWYNVTKAAVIQLTRQLAFELGPHVRVNALAPGLVRTDLARALWEQHGDVVAERLPLKRLGEPDDIARAAVFLLSDAAAWITGHTLVIDGGALTMPSGGV
jgi:NAD(P)-dependent dehydrogenase (short-subunit alcohol dehydrogenase family)